jgi:hypothetical protein
MLFNRLRYWLRCLAAWVRGVGREVRLGHAFRSVPSATDMTDLAEVLRILNGELALNARPPADPGAVNGAESMLGLARSPVYTYAGCLHPALGTIGLVIAPRCLARCMQGVSRCDTGGLAGRRGSFAYLKPEDVQTALRRLTCANYGWRPAFSAELAVSYDSVREYVAGTVPQFETWDDARAVCLDSHFKAESTLPDRRLWTWEVRLAAAPGHTEYEALILSPEAYKKLENLRLSGAAIPGRLRIVHGRAAPAGIHHFHEAATIDTLCGGRST